MRLSALHIFGPDMGTGSAMPIGTPAEPTESFGKVLSEALNKVDKLQQDASLSAAQMVMGSDNYLHNVVLAYEKADLAFQLTVEVRNKLIEAYQEVMRIQM